MWHIQSPGHDEIKTLIYSERLGYYTLYSGRVGLPKVVEVEFMTHADLFSLEQIEKLRSEYAKLETVPIDNLDKFHAVLSKMNDDQLQQVREARIKFLSPLAVNEMVRRGR